MVRMIFTVTEKIGSPILGIIIPGTVLIIAVVATYLLYRHFSGKTGS